APHLVRCCALHHPSSLFNNFGHGIRSRHVDGVTAWSFDNNGTCTLGHEALGRGWDHSVVSGNQVPTRLCLPRRLGDLAVQCFEAPRHLRVGHERGFLRFHVSSERGGDLCFVWGGIILR